MALVGVRVVATDVRSDLLAGSAIVYDWDARAARLRFLARSSSGTEVARF